MVKLTKKKCIKIIKGGSNKSSTSFFSRIKSAFTPKPKKLNNETIMQNYIREIYKIYNRYSDILNNDNVIKLNKELEELTIKYSTMLPKDKHNKHNINNKNNKNNKNNINKLQKQKDSIIIEIYFDIIKETLLKKLINNKIKINSINTFNLEEKTLTGHFIALLTKDPKDQQNLENLWKLKKQRDRVIIAYYNKNMQYILNNARNTNNNADSVNENIYKLTATYEKILGRDPSFYWDNRDEKEKLNIQEQKDKEEFIKSQTQSSSYLEENFGGGYCKKHKIL